MTFFWLSVIRFTKRFIFYLRKSIYSKEFSFRAKHSEELFDLFIYFVTPLLKNGFSKLNSTIKTALIKIIRAMCLVRARVNNQDPEANRLILSKSHRNTAKWRFQVCVTKQQTKGLFYTPNEIRLKSGDAII